MHDPGVFILGGYKYEAVWLDFVNKGNKTINKASVGERVKILGSDELAGLEVDNDNIETSPIDATLTTVDSD